MIINTPRNFNSLASGALAASKYKSLHKFRGGKTGQAAAGRHDLRRSRKPLRYDDPRGALTGKVWSFRLTSESGWDLDKQDHLRSSRGHGRKRSGGRPDPRPRRQPLRYDSSGKASMEHGASFRAGSEFGRNLDRKRALQALPKGVPTAGLIFDQAGNLYGTTVGLAAPADRGAASADTEPRWELDGEHPLQLQEGQGWTVPWWSDLIFDPTGNLYGTTAEGGDTENGVVFKLTPNKDGSWSESVLHSFTGADGYGPIAVIFDRVGNLYGTTVIGGAFSRYSLQADAEWGRHVD